MVDIDRLETAHRLPSDGRYRAGAIAFHWTMVVLVVIVGGLGLLHDSWPKTSQGFWINVHALMGMGLWVVLLARLGFRLRHSPPMLPPELGSFSRRFSSPVHLALYALLFVVPIVGVVTFVYHGRTFHFGFFELDLGIKKKRAIFEPTEDIHAYLAYGLFALAGLHACAAMWHQLVLHDGVMARMWPDRGRAASNLRGEQRR